MTKDKNPETEVVKIRLGSEIKKKLEEIAESEQRTFAGQIRLALQEWIENKSRGARK
jgi:predicted transcriptional regulator